MRKIVEVDGKFIHAICPGCGNRDVDISDPGLGCFLHCEDCDKYWSFTKNKRTLEYEWKLIPRISLVAGGPPIMHSPAPTTWCNIKGIGKGLPLT